MSSILEIYNETFEQVRSDKSQKHFNDVLSELRKQKFSMEDIEAIFVPNNDFLLSLHSGWEESNIGAYRDGLCNYVGEMIAPIKNVMGNIVGFVGFDPMIYADVHSGEGTGNYYIYHMMRGYKKSNYLYYPGKSFEDCMHTHLLLVDGVFDAISLTREGFNAGALMGSTVSKVHRAIFDIVDNVYLCMDNDDAGTKLATSLRFGNKKIEIIKQHWTKDADECLKSAHRDDYLAILKSVTEKSK